MALVADESVDSGIVKGLRQKGIVVFSLIRLSELPRKERLELAVKTISKHLHKLKNTFSVLTKNGIRVKIIK
jgi:hypothetical protein